MQLGQIVDYVISFNERQKQAEEMAERKPKKERPKRRLATQAEIDAYFG